MVGTGVKASNSASSGASRGRESSIDQFMGTDGACRKVVFVPAAFRSGRARPIGFAEQPGAGMGLVLALIDFVMDAGDQRAFDPAGGAHPFRIRHDRDAIDRADQADDEGEVLQLLDDRRQRDRGRAADIGEDVELRRGVEDRFDPGERGRDVGGGEMAFRDDGDGAGGEGGEGEHMYLSGNMKAIWLQERNANARRHRCCRGTCCWLTC